MQCNEVTGILAELMLGSPRQRAGDRARWHEVEEQAANDLRYAIESLQVDEVHAELMPHQTQQHVEALQRDGQMVAMIGDGVNDATALVQPTVGAAMGSGTAVAMESADVVLIGNDLGKFVDTVRIARR